ncbi:hypothetical protein B0H14DRAFT_2630538 [Mycena olivaceomarginata]|nr:hypothetical protein B0H14DRAFT_2630538 [Mycena olivaceomarginata]
MSDFADYQRYFSSAFCVPARCGVLGALTEFDRPISKSPAVSRGVRAILVDPSAQSGYGTSALVLCANTYTDSRVTACVGREVDQKASDSAPPVYRALERILGKTPFQNPSQSLKKTEDRKAKGDFSVQPIRRKRGTTERSDIPQAADTSRQSPKDRNAIRRFLSLCNSWYVYRVEPQVEPRSNVVDDISSDEKKPIRAPESHELARTVVKCL